LKSNIGHHKDDYRSKAEMFTFVDIFAGCGGLSLGLMQAGWKGLFAVERDPNAFQTLHDNLIATRSDLRFDWPNWLPRTAHDVSEVLTDKRSQLEALSGQVDMLVGGPPCQGFSSAGKRNPNDPRNKMVEEYLQFVRVLKPRIVLIENVIGITNDFVDKSGSEETKNYARWIIQSLSEDYDVTFRLIDTSLFGVPQKRHRIFIIGRRLDDHSLAEVIFEAIERDRQTFLRNKGILTIPVSVRSAISDLEIRRNKKVASEECVGFEEIAYLSPRTSYQTIMNKGLVGKMPDTRLARHRPHIEKRFKELIELCHRDGRLSVSISRETRESFGLRKHAIRVLDPDAPSPTITSMPDDLIHYSEPRVLSVRENARLQSFPDWFAFKGKYTTGGDRRKMEVPRFTQVANAVPPLVAEAFGQAIAKILS